jgi:hypothetical protein
MKILITLLMILSSFSVMAQVADGADQANDGADQEIDYAKIIADNEARVNKVVDEFVNSIYMKDNSNRELLRKQAKAKILDAIDGIPQEHEIRTHLYNLVLEQAKESKKIAATAQSSYEKLQVCAELSGKELRPMSKVVSRLAEAKDPEWVNENEQLMKMYTYGIVEQGHALSKMAEYSLQYSSCMKEAKDAKKKLEDQKSCGETEGYPAGDNTGGSIGTPSNAMGY